jgi:membrane-bound lytic murein transglycosylase D
LLWNVARVESGFQARALSPKGALGMWQFMPETARQFGLRVGDDADDRLDPELSARAATRYLGYLHGLFGDWKLALAGYNAGEQRVQRAIEQTGTRDFDELARRGALPRETQRYVPKVMAGVPVEAPVSQVPQVLIAPIKAN